MSESNKQRTDWETNGPRALPETLPPPTVWPATLSFGITLLAFGVLTSPFMYVTGLIVLVFATAGWIEDLRNDQK